MCSRQAVWGRGLRRRFKHWLDESGTPSRPCTASPADRCRVAVAGAPRRRCSSGFRPPSFFPAKSFSWLLSFLRPWHGLVIGGKFRRLMPGRIYFLARVFAKKMLAETWRRAGPRGRKNGAGGGPRMKNGRALAGNGGFPGRKSPRGAGVAARDCKGGKTATGPGQDISGTRGNNFERKL